MTYYNSSKHWGDHMELNNSLPCISYDRFCGIFQLQSTGKQTVYENSKLSLDDLRTYIQGGSDISGTLSMFHRRIKKPSFFIYSFVQNRLCCLPKHKYNHSDTFQQR
jgi:hypothetical protein